jgi:uncharacterized protein DUF2628
MSVYTVHEPPLKADGTEPEPERFVFVRDGFGFWAFLLGPLWMLRHRMWLAFLGYIIVTVALQVGLRFMGASATVIAVTLALLSLLIGFEAASLRRFTLWRRHWKNIGIVVGDDLEAAERRFFDAWMSGSRGGRSSAGAEQRAAVSSAAAASTGTRWSPRSPHVIGLFPQPGAPR